MAIIMGRTLEGATDAGSMVVFDPAALPDGFDTAYKEDPIAQLEELQTAGRLCWINTEGDGGYELGVYTGTRLPNELRPYARSIDEFDSFPIPSGRLYFTGIEYVFKNDDSFLRKYPHMAETAQLEPGSYRAEFLEFEYPEEFHEDFLRQKLPPYSASHPQSHEHTDADRLPFIRGAAGLRGEIELEHVADHCAALRAGVDHAAAHSG